MVASSNSGSTDSQNNNKALWILVIILIVTVGLLMFGLIAVIFKMATNNAAHQKVNI